MSLRHRRSLALCASLFLVSAAFAVRAQATADPATDGFLQTIFAECRVQLELGDTECACVVERSRTELAPIEIEYTAMRITGNDAEVERLRLTLNFFQRIGILATVTQLIQDCANGAPFRNPL